ncbi:MAG: septal ring lytic transglycosylase RlpA family lipoprotein [Candidatus Omnitrophica bacterium CG11_big_fil_rev_8_21_14_0_20_63_9]|nr:MAG: septal ring lytic transglycosylase RlpA family lipoprotein [Candidatus Omnitrophica bacterium CG11_big_fil_rev_8_21_14_0_20_63_9]
MGRWLLGLALAVSAIRVMDRAPEQPAIPPTTSGLASWYGGGEPLNTHVAMGHRFNPEALEAAMWDVPLGASVKVTNLENGRSIVVRVTDRGPARRLSRAIDLTRASFAKLAPLEQGLIPVRIQPLF